MSGQPNPPRHSETPAPPAAPRKKRRLLRSIALVFGLLVVVLVGLVAAAPMLLSAGFARAMVLDQVNGRVPGRVQIDGLSLAWLGGNELRGVKVQDPAGRDVLQIDRLRVERGIWALAWSPYDLGRIELDRPQILLVIDEENHVLLSDAFVEQSRRETGTQKPAEPASDPAKQPAEPASPPAKQPAKPRAAETPQRVADATPRQPESPLPAIRGQVVVRDGTVRTVRQMRSAAGTKPANAGSPSAAYEVTNLSLDVDVQTLDRVVAQAAMRLADGAMLKLETDLGGLAPEGRLRPMEARGRLTIRSDKPIDLEPLMLVVAPDLGVRGELALDVRTSGTAEDALIEIDLAANRLRAGASEAPIDLTLRGTVERAADSLKLRGALAGGPGKLEIEAGGKLNGATTPTGEQLAAAVVGSGVVVLPEFGLQARGEFDLARLEEALPGILKVREGVRLRSGTLEIAELNLSGGRTPTVTLRGGLRDVTAESGGETFALQPIRADVRAALQADRGLTVERGELTASFANVQAKGDPTRLMAEVRADLNALQREVGRIVDFGSVALAGSIQSALQLERAADDRLSFVLSADGSGVRVVAGERAFDAARLQVRSTADVELRGQQAPRVSVRQAELDLDGQLAASAKGWIDLEQRAYQFDADVSRADLAYVARQAAAGGVKGLEGYTGQLALKASVSQAGADQPILAAGAVSGQSIANASGPLLEGETRVQWEKLEVAPDGGRLTLATLTLNSAAGSVRATDVHYAGGESTAVRAALSVKADMARAMRVAVAAGAMTEPPAVAGALDLDARVETTGQKITIGGKGGVNQFVWTSGERRVEEPRLDFDLAAALDQAASRLALERVKLGSRALKAEVSGTIDKFDAAMVADLRGRYDADWQPLSTILHDLAPATAELVTLSGKAGSEFSLHGPLRQEGAMPGFRGAAGAVSLGWQEGHLVEIPIGATQLNLKLADGRVTLPPAAIAAAGGNIRLGGALDFTSGEPTLHIRERLNVLDKVKLTRELGKQLLGRINPVFSRAGGIEGVVSLGVEGVSLPLGESMSKTGAGRGDLDMGTLRVQPGPFLSELLQLAGLPGGEPRPMEIGRVAITLKDGRLHYENLTLRFQNEAELRFRGSVGLDGALNLVVSLPVRGALLRRLGVTGPALEYVTKAENLRVDIPLAGTLEKPRLDLSQVDTRKLVAEILKDRVTDPGQLNDLIRGLRGGQREEPPPRREEPRRGNP